MNDKSSCIDLLFITNSKLLCDVGISKLFIVNAIIILYMDHIISKYLFPHFTVGKFGITKTQIRYVYSV